MLTSLQGYYQRVYTFLTRDIWLREPTPAWGVSRWLFPIIRVVLMVSRGFFIDHQCLLRASALTYTMLLALVPMLAFMFAFLKGLGVQNLLEPLLVDKLPIGSETTVRQIITYVNQIKVGTLGVVGLVSLLGTTLLQLSTVEQAFNAIWGLRSGRPAIRVVTDYISILVIGPIVLLFVTGVNTAMQNQTLVATLLQQRVIGDAMMLGFTCMPYVILWFVFAFFYAFLPYTHVKLIPALIGGLVGGTLWQLAQWAYLEFQFGVKEYELIYGALAQLPVFMVWLYTSWLIMLLGAEVSYACQHVRHFSWLRVAHTVSFHTREWLASQLYFSLTQAFMTGKTPWSARAFAQEHRLPMPVLREILQPLQDEQLLVETAATPEHYVPGRDPATITPWHILHALRHQGDTTAGMSALAQQSPATSLMTQVENAMQHAAGAGTIPQWLAGEVTTPAVPADPRRSTS